MAISFRPLRANSVERYRVAASQTIAVGDPVVMNASGLVEVGAATSTKLLGVAAEAITTTGSVDAEDTIGVFNDPSAHFIVKAASSTTGQQAKVGDLIDVSGSTGAFLANFSAQATGVLEVLAIGSFYDPLQDGTSGFKWTDGKDLVVKIAKHSLAVEAGAIESVVVPLSLTANGTYATYWAAPVGARVVSAGIVTPTVFASTGGTVLLYVNKGSSGGNTMQSAASLDLEGVSANAYTALTLTSTEADLTLAANGLVYVSVVSNNADATGPAESAARLFIRYIAA